MIILFESVDIFCTTLVDIAATDHHYNVTHYVIVNRYAIDVICDSGTEISVLPKHAVPNLLIAPTKLTLHAWGNFDLPVLGSSACSVSYYNKTVKKIFLVVDLQNKSTKPLLSFWPIKELGIISELAMTNSDSLQSMSIFATEFTQSSIV